MFAPNIVVLVVPPSGKISIVDVVVPHPAQQVHVSPVCTCAVIALLVRRLPRWRISGELGNARQHYFVAFAVKSYGRLGSSAPDLPEGIGGRCSGTQRRCQCDFYAKYQLEGELCIAARALPDVREVVQRGQ
jgi:hypothetical protein